MSLLEDYLERCHPRTRRIVQYDESKNGFVLQKFVDTTSINLAALAEVNFGWDLWQHQGKRLAALEEFVNSCFSYRDQKVLFDWIDDTDVMEHMEPDYREYLIELINK
ncbi:hypothetical protein ACW05P_002988 [Acinetobacter baumannii]|nr:hypothetical protein [Acinetobacter baumannii]HCW3892833.1 hypothetical protein [Acinetobacter baumannii]